MLLLLSPEITAFATETLTAKQNTPQTEEYFGGVCQGTDAGQVMNKNNNYEGVYGTGSMKDMSGSAKTLVPIR